MGFFQFVKVEHSVLTHKHFHHLGRKEIHVIHGMVTDQQFGLCSVFKDNHDTAVHHKINIGTQNVYQLDRLFNHYTLRYEHKYAILCKHGVESHQTFLRSIGQLPIIFLHQLWILAGHVLQASENHPFRQRRIRLFLCIESIVHHKVKRCTQIRDITFKYLIRINRNSQTVKVQPIVGSKIFAHIGILVLFLLTGREAKLLKMSERLSARSIQHIHAMLADRRLILREKINILLFCFHAHSPNSFLIQS